MNEYDIEVDEETGLVTFKQDGETVHIMPKAIYEYLRLWSPTNGNRMDLTEFVNEGYLHEINRQVLHPMGLALEVIADDESDKVYRLGGVWDYRDDPEGMAFAEDTLNATKAAHIAELSEQRRPAREEALGYWIQPLPVSES